MAINKKLIHFQKLATFKQQLAANNILDTSIVFIKDAQQIWTHGQYYSITDAPADGNSYVRKNNGWVISPSGIEVYIGKDEPSSEYKVWFNTEDGSLYYYNNGWVALYTGEPKDLSMRDIYGNIRNTATTANCYVIKEKGTYRIPLVYGNAVVNGSTNSASYTKVSGTYSLDFVNGAGTIINTPFIEKQTVISNAELSIADTYSIFTDISVKSMPNVTDISNCGYIQFKVASIPSTGANGVISIMNSSGTVIWNWHIWIWADNLSTVSITNSSGVTYNILPYNLASKWDSSETSIKNWFYQWGRSVPMLCPSAYNSTDNHARFGKLGFTTAPVASTYNQGIANPTTFYYNKNSTIHNWFGNTSYYNLWDANCTKVGASDKVTVKTVYDPCPPGFKIPNGNTFTRFNNYDDYWNSGYTWNGTFFPASGERYDYNGLLRSVGQEGLIWTSAAHSQDYVYHVRFSDGNLSGQGGTYRASGLSVRPVAES